MRIVTTREMRADTKTIFELAEKERVAVKRGKKYVNLIVTDNPATKFVSEDYLKEFMSIPAEYRVNPFEVSPSGDLFFADKRNVEQVELAIERSRTKSDGKTIEVHSKKELHALLESL